MFYVSGAKVRDVCLIILTAIALTAALAYTRPVVVPLVFAIFITIIIEPVLVWLHHRLKLPRMGAVALTLIVLAVVLLVLGFFVGLSVGRFLEDADIYRDRIVNLAAQASGQLTPLGLPADPAEWKKELAKLPIFGWAGRLGGGVLTFAGNLALVLVFSLFLILGSARHSGKPQFLAEIQGKLTRYVSVKTGISLITGALTAIILGVLGVELAFMFAVLTFLLNFIPSIGSIVAVLLPLPVVVLQFGFSWQFGVVLGGLGIIQFSLGNVIEPKLMGEALDLHPVTILVFLIFWGLVWGIPGMFLAVPVTAAMRLAFAQIRPLRPAAELMSGNWPT